MKGWKKQRPLCRSSSTAEEDGYEYPKSYRDSEFWNRDDEEGAPKEEEDDVSDDSEGKSVLQSIFAKITFIEVSGLGGIRQNLTIVKEGRLMSDTETI